MRQRTLLLEPKGKSLGRDMICFADKGGKSPNDSRVRNKSMKLLEGLGNDDSQGSQKLQSEGIPQAQLSLQKKRLENLQIMKR